MNGLDISFDAHKVTPDWCAARIAEGYGVLVVNAWAGNTSPAGVELALRNWREAGGETRMYYVPHAFNLPEYHLAQARAACGAEWQHLSRVCVDVEDINTGDPPSVQWHAGHLRDSLNLITAAGKVPEIYTARGWWLRLGNWQTFTDIKLWDASWGAPAPAFVPYGGWTERAGHQWLNDQTVDGVTCDLNVFADAGPATVDWYTETVNQMHARWAQAERLEAEAAATKADVIAAKVRLGIS